MFPDVCSRPASPTKPRLGPLQPRAARTWVPGIVRSALRSLSRLLRGQSCLALRLFKERGCLPGRLWPAFQPRRWPLPCTPTPRVLESMGGQLLRLGWSHIPLTPRALSDGPMGLGSGVCLAVAPWSWGLKWGVGGGFYFLCSLAAGPSRSRGPQAPCPSAWHTLSSQSLGSPARQAPGPAAGTFWGRFNLFLDGTPLLSSPHDLKQTPWAGGAGGGGGLRSRKGGRESEAESGQAPSSRVRPCPPPVKELRTEEGLGAASSLYTWPRSFQGDPEAPARTRSSHSPSFSLWGRGVHAPRSS